MTSLKPFEGEPVLQSSIVIPNAGGGLREALKIEPAEWHKGDRVFVVLECVVGDVTFKPIKGVDSGLNRVHKFEAEHATITDETLVGAQLAEQKKRIREAAGEYELPLDPAADPEGDPLGVFACGYCGHDQDAHTDGEGDCLALDDHDEPACDCHRYVAAEEAAPGG